MLNPSNWVTSLIRTFVPVWVGSLFVIIQGFLDEHQILWIHIDSQQAAAWSTGIAISLYYFVVRLLERKWPKFGVLLGSAKKPVYVPPVPESALPEDTIMPPFPETNNLK